MSTEGGGGACAGADGGGGGNVCDKQLSEIAVKLIHQGESVQRDWRNTSGHTSCTTFGSTFGNMFGNTCGNRRFDDCLSSDSAPAFAQRHEIPVGNPLNTR